MKISELFAEVGFKFDSIRLNEVNQLLGKLNLSSVVAASELAAMGVVIGTLIASTVEWNKQLSDLSSRMTTLHATTGVGTTFAQQFEGAAEALQATKEEADNVITALATIQTGIRLGQGLPAGLQMFAPNMDFFMGTREEQIKKINDLMSKPAGLMNQAEAEQRAGLLSYFTKQLGASPQMLQVFENPKMMEIMAKINTVSPEMLAAAADSTMRWSIATHNLNVELEIVAGRLKPITDFLSAVIEATGGGLKSALGDSPKPKTLAQDEAISKKAMQEYHDPVIDFLRNLMKPHTQMPMASTHTTKHITIKPTITVNAKDSKDVVKELEAWWAKMMANTASEFGLGQT